jgi:hypothetical protein
LSNVLRQNRVTTHGSIVYSYIGIGVGFYELVWAAVVAGNGKLEGKHRADSWGNFVRGFVLIVPR